MRKLLAVFIAMFLTGLVASANAGEFGDLRTKMGAARESLIAMMLHKDQRGPEQQKWLKTPLTQSVRNSPG